MKVTGLTREGIHPGFETQNRRHQKSKIEVLVARLKRNFVLQYFFEKNLIVVSREGSNCKSEICQSFLEVYVY